MFNEFSAGFSEVPYRFRTIKEGLKRQLLFLFKLEEFVERVTGFGGVGGFQNLHFEI